ncbi:nuclear pore membrane glycoprotein 210 [Pelomyxa schiedti]|nr:nuclear pore membrane glycoprotein 210 [Pelomyxa schiedti]
MMPRFDIIAAAVVLWHAISISCGEVPSISAVNILLPFGTEGGPNIAFPLQVSGGCFTWSTDNPMVATVQPLKTHREKQLTCVDSVSVISKKLPVGDIQNIHHRHSTWVTAEDQLSDSILRCEVSVDDIHRLDIATTTRILYKGLVQVVSLTGFDSSNNHFSTLEGILFDWTIETLSLSTPFRIRNFRDVSVEASQMLLELEAKGLRSNAVALESMTVGKAKLSSCITGNSRVPPVSAVMTVLLQLVLSPAKSLYVVPGSVIKYSLSVRAPSGNLEVVSLPSHDFIWSTSDISIATVEAHGVVTISPQVKVSTTVQVCVTSSYMQESRTCGTIFVSQPHSVHLDVYRDNELLPESSPLITGQKYFVEMKVLDSEEHILQLSDSFRFSIHLDTTKFDIPSSTRDSFSVIPKNTGLTQISVSATVVDMKNLVLNKDISVVLPVKISPEKLLLPPAFNSHFQLQATGGSGVYQWRTSDSSVAIVGVSGILTFVSGNVGTVQVQLLDAATPSNFDEISVVIDKISLISANSPTLSLFVGGSILLGIIAKDSSGQFFDDCTAVPFEWKSSLPHVTFSSQTKPESARICAGVQATFPHEGVAQITASFKDRAGLTISTQFTITVHAEVSLSGPDLLTFGAAGKFTITGGPEPSSSTFYELTSNTDSLEIANNPANKREFSISCFQFGKHVISILYGGASVTTFELECLPPSKLLLEPVSGSCIAESPIALKTGGSLMFTLKVFDEQSRQFPNISTLHISYLSSDPSIASWQTDKQTASLHGNQKGLITISASISSFTPQTLADSKTRTIPSLTTLSHSLQLRVYDSLSVSPQQVTLLNHMTSRAIIKVISGSGMYSFGNGNSDIIRVTDIDSASVQVEALKSGTTAILVRDSCGNEERVVSILVIDVQALSIDIDKDLLLVGNRGEVRVRAFDVYEHLIPEDLLQALSIKLRLKDDTDTGDGVISISSDTPTSFSIKALNAGTTALIAYFTTREGKVISSPPKLIQVYKDITISPPELSLSLGFFGHLQLQGGPPSSTSQVKWIVDNPTIATVVDGVVTTRKIGTTHAFAEVELKPGNVLRSANSITIAVKEMPKIKIQSTLQAVVGSQISAYLKVEDASSPDTLLSLGITPNWTVSNPTVLQLDPQDSHLLSVSLLALSPGKCLLAVKLQQDKFVSSFKIDDTIEISVLDKVEFLHPSSITVAPHSIFHVKLSSPQVSFQVSSGERLIQVHRDAKSDILVHSLSNLGAAVVLFTDEPTEQKLPLSVNVATPTALMVKMTSSNVPCHTPVLVNFTAVTSRGIVFAELGDYSVETTISPKNLLDVLPVEGGLVLTGKHTGLTVVGVTLTSNWFPALYTVFQVKTVQAFNINEPVLTTGDEVRFHYSGEQDKEWTWRSSNSSVFRIEPTTGVGIASSVGSVEVEYGASQTTVTVQEISGVNIGNSTDAALLCADDSGTHAKCSKTLRLPLQLLTKVGVLTSQMSSVRRNLVVECSSQSPVAVAYSTTDKTLSCVLSATNTILQIYDIKITIKIKNPQTNSAFVTEVKVPYHPIFTVINKPFQIQFGKAFKLSTYKLSIANAPPVLEVTSTHPNLLSISKVASSYQLELTAEGRSAPFSGVQVTFTDPLCDKQESIKVSYDGTPLEDPTSGDTPSPPSTPDSEPKNTNLRTYMGIGVAIVLAFIATLWYRRANA